jgi:hypothetical protein
VGRWDAVDRRHVLDAAREYDAIGRDRFLTKYGFGAARSYTLVIEGRTYESKAILGAAYGYATGQPRRSNEFSGGVGADGAATVLQRLGFKIVTSAESQPRNTKPTISPSRTVASSAVEGIPADVVLVGCVKTKQPVAAPAHDLYTSPLFRKRRRYAETTGKPWFILSALHGLVDPDQVLQPYDMYLPGQTRDYQQRWAQRVVDALPLALGTPLQDLVVEIHAGLSYVQPLHPLLVQAGARVSAPLRGLTQGQHLAWYDEPRVNAVHQEQSAAQIEAIARTAIGVLTGTQPQPAAAFPWHRTDLDRPGLYAWWVDREGASDLQLPEPHEDLSLAYTGQAGATKWPSGIRSSATLLSRI